MNTINPEVFHLAAEGLNELDPISVRGCCWAIERATHELVGYGNLYLYREFLEDTLKPNSCDLWWYCEPVDTVDDTPESLRNARIIGLLLCALLIEEAKREAKP